MGKYKRNMTKSFFKTIIFILAILSIFLGFKAVLRRINENRTLKEVISRLEAESRIAEVLVTNVNYDEKTGKTLTTIKFLEYDAGNRPLESKYFTFPGNIIQFQSLVVRFDDFFIKKGSSSKDKSICLFWKIFMLDGENTREYELTKIREIPRGYKLEGRRSPAEEKFWVKFWDYALEPKQAKKQGIKNAQIEAPGTMFIPGTIYTIKIEHDGGMRIDAKPLPAILKGEKIPDV